MVNCRSPKPDPVIATFAPNKGPLNLSFDPSSLVKSEGAKILAPLNLYVALDVTGSMQANIEALKLNIGQFSIILKQKGYKVRLGLIPFRDGLEVGLDLTDNLQAFINLVALQSAVGGGQDWEASLMAIGHGVNRLQALSAPGDANAILVITDNPGHYGANELDCNINGLVAKLNALPAEFQKSLRIYGSIGNGTRPCTLGYPTGPSQWDKILETSLLASEVGKRGSKLSYPFNGTVILDEFVKSLEKTLPPVDNICLATKANLKDGTTDLGTWPPESLAQVYEKHKKSEKITWANVAPESVYKTWVGKTLNLELTRCCADRTKVEKGDFAGCVDQATTAKIEIK